MMTPADIAQHNATLAQLTAEDGIPRLTWEQHGAAFEQPAPDGLTPGQLVAVIDSATPGTVGTRMDRELYEVTFPDLGFVCGYPATQLRPWPLS